MKLRRSLALIAAAVLSFSTSIFAENWPQWRGPNFNGSSTEKNLPASFSKTENVVWTVDLPGPSAATPVIWEDHVFVSSGDERTKTLQAFCIDRKTGKVRWQNETGVVYQRDNNSNTASPSPATDGKLVVFFYGNGDLVAYDLAGKAIWSRNIEKDYGDFAFQWTFAASPLLYQGKLFMQVLQRNVPVHNRGKTGGESYLLALDPATGKTLWRQVRPSKAVAESLEAFTTPMPFEFQGRKEILIAGGDDLTGHDPETGKELWRWGTWNPTRIGHWRLVPSPAAGDGIILACAPKKDPIYAIKAGGSGLLDDSAIAWKSDKGSDLSSDVPTPLFYKGDFFILGDSRNSISRVEPRTGKVKWTTPLTSRSKIESSPTGADGKIYFMHFSGEVVVVDSEDGKILKTVAMGEPGDNKTRSSIPFAHGQLFIRTNTKLFCIGNR
jgi:outer membrane protein assembly factor BamB